MKKPVYIPVGKISTKTYPVCLQCIAKAKATQLNKVENICSVGTTCVICGKMNAIKELSAGHMLVLKAKQKKEVERKAKAVADFKIRKAQAELDEAKAKAERQERVRKPIKLRSISLS